MKPSPKRRGAAPGIGIQSQKPRGDAQPPPQQTVREAIAAAAKAAPAEGEVSVLLTDDAAIQELNRTWRGIDKPTNVLSFPAAEKAGELLGDIVIAYETLHAESAAEGKPFLHHLAHLAVHGFLHLLGYDHATDSQAAAMEGLEREVLASLDIADPYRAHETGNA